MAPRAASVTKQPSGSGLVKRLVGATTDEAAAGTRGKGAATDGRWRDELREGRLHAARRRRPRAVHKCAAVRNCAVDGRDNLLLLRSRERACERSDLRRHPILVLKAALVIQQHLREPLRVIEVLDPEADRRAASIWAPKVVGAQPFVANIQFGPTCLARRTRQQDLPMLPSAHLHALKVLRCEPLPRGLRRQLSGRPLARG
eukprot:scaffold145629_cov105-Phaeocystis_antarctica.AAC.2